MSKKSESFLDGEVRVVDLEDLEVVEADADVEGADAAGALHVHRRDVPVAKINTLPEMSYEHLK